jgi:hypothetical protein
MGRWAEVYFTSPPEKREQAVLELLRELEAKNSSPDDRFGTTPSWMPDAASRPIIASRSQAFESHPVLAHCQTCGRELPLSQKFCGMCGTRQGHDDTAANSQHVADLHIEDQQIADCPPSQAGSWISRDRVYDPPEHHVYESRSGPSDLSLFQNDRETRYGHENDDEIFSYAPRSRPYRLYVGFALAIVIVVLGYMAWRSTQATSQTAHVEPQAPPAVASQPATAAPVPESPSSRSSNTDSPDQTSQTEKPATVPPSNPTRSGGRERNAKAAGDTASPAAPPATISNTEKNSQAEASAGNGTEELVIAQRYLNGGNGLRADHAEAAKWLWKAMANHNSTAMLLLADLYLKGTGVSKNCDQARVLLDSAARAGVKEAGQRLRHLQAFGCE